MRIHRKLIFMDLTHGIPAVGPKEVPAGLSAGQGERLGAEGILCSWWYIQGLQYAAFWTQSCPPLQTCLQLSFASAL